MKNRSRSISRSKNCLDPALGKKVYDYYNGVLDAVEVTEFERHLINCPRCERIILQLDHSLAALNDEQRFSKRMKE